MANSGNRGTETQSFGSCGRINHNSAKFYNSKLYAEYSAIETKGIETEFPKQYINQIICGDARKMKEIPDNSVHLMITSPPYNVSKEYDEDLSLKEYLDLLQKVFEETYRVLINGGRACVNIANVGRKPYIPLTDYISKILIDIGFNMRGEIIWNKSTSAGASTAWGSWQSASNPILRDIHEYILVCSKGDFKRVKGIKENTISKKDFMEWTKSIWDMKTESAKKVGHPAPFPIELPRRLIELYSFKDDIILDPFMGSGTTAIAAINAKRKYVGYEINEKYVSLARIRISENIKLI